MKYVKSVTTEILQQYLDDVHTAYLSIMANRGFTVIDGEVVGKRGDTDDEDAQHTTAFDTIKTMNDGSGWFYCLNAKHTLADRLTPEELATLPDAENPYEGLVEVDSLEAVEVEIPVLYEPEDEESFNEFGEPDFGDEEPMF